MGPEVDPLRTVAGSFHRRRVVRRLTRAEADLVGFAGPLILVELGPRIRLPVLRRLQGRPTYEIVRHPDTVVLRLSATELATLGVTP